MSSQFPNPTIAIEIPLTMPVKLGDANGANKSTYALFTNLFAFVGATADVGKIENEFEPVKALLPARDAFEFYWVVVAFDTGFSKSLVLSQFPKPTIVDVIPITFPVNVVL